MVVHFPQEVIPGDAAVLRHPGRRPVAVARTRTQGVAPRSRTASSGEMVREGLSSVSPAPVASRAVSLPSFIRIDMSEISDMLPRMAAPAPDVFAALGNPVRRRILELLRTRPRTSGEIAAAFELSRPAVSEHLQVLRLAGLVREEARGRQRIHHLEGAGLVS